MADPARGVHYTPDDIVDFMVAATLGPLLEAPTPARVASLRVLDPSCGAGAFLLGVYRLLLDWHQQVYARELTSAEKRRILLDNIYGVDIDARAVEAAKRSLELLAGESVDLSANIKCGNALIETDCGVAKSTESMLPFDWPAEFPDIFSRPNPGFDVVLGNPPYVDAEWTAVHQPLTRAYCARKYATASGNWDLFCVFIERSLQLLRDEGRHAFIVPNKLASAEYAAAARRLLAIENRLLLLRDYSRVPVFPVAVYPIVYVVEKSRTETARREPVCYQTMAAGPNGGTVVASSELDYETGFSHPERAWPIFVASAAERGLLRVLEQFPALQTVATVLGGATVAEAYELLPLLSEAPHPADDDLRVLNSGTIDPHRPLWGQRPMRYLKRSFEYPVVLGVDQAKLPANRLQQARTPKLIISGMTKSLECVADVTGEYIAAKSTTIVIPKQPIDLLYLAAVLNSRLLSQLFRAMFGGLSLQGGYLRVGPPQIQKLPICVPEPDAKIITDIRAWVAQGLWTQIEEAVCELYGLRPEQTRAVLASVD
jgi:tRNA1(Val) A37 N6-methylase TrmN6